MTAFEIGADYSSTDWSYDSINSYECSNVTNKCYSYKH